MKLKLIAIILFVSVFTVTSICQADNAKQSGGSSPNTTYGEVDQVRDVSMYGGRIKRVVVNIIIPLGRTEKEVHETLKKAAIEIGKREHAKAAAVKGYRPQDKERTGTYTVGQATYAPNGKWGDADSNAPMSVTVELSKDSLYFRKEQTTKTGKNFILKEAQGGPISISRNRDNWGDKNIIAKIPSGTPVSVLERYEVPISSSMLLTRVHVRVEKKKLEGWVFGSDVAPK